jgi:site-specific DNA-methyltransferase (adenine-specific)
VLEINKTHQGDCSELMQLIDDQSIDMILCDLPYGTTACSWDQVIPFDALWTAYKRIIKPRGAIVLTASQPFTSALVMSNPKWFRTEWIWEKTIAANFMNRKHQPSKLHENVLVFSKQAATYNAQMIKGNSRTNGGNCGAQHYDIKAAKVKKYYEESCPSSIIRFANGSNNSLHPTQKPLALFEYLIRTYSNPDDLILDNCAGSGTTGKAALNLGRRFIMIERDPNYCNIARKRCETYQPELY